MVRHIVSWNFKPELSEEERRAAAETLVARMTALRDLVPCVERLEVFQPPIGLSNCDLCMYTEIDKEENPLITNDTMCQALANHVKSYLQMRNTYEANYRGNPEMEVGDIIGLQTLYTDEMDALILVDEITFDGSLSGKMTVKGLI